MLPCNSRPQGASEATKRSPGCNGPTPAGVPVLKRVLPALGVLAALGLVIWLIRRITAK